MAGSPPDAEFPCEWDDLPGASPRDGAPNGESLPERLAHEACRRIEREGDAVTFYIVRTAIRAALKEAAKVAREGIDEDGGYAPDATLNRALNTRTWAAQRRIAAKIEALKG